MDFTKGFFQAPLDENSSKYTAFATWHGLFEWVRVPMGLKGAPSWFQQQVSTKVLGGLLQHICELYIDDLIIYASTIGEFIQNLRLVFERLRKYKVIVNPGKCIFITTEVTFIGYLLDKKGIEMTEEKKQKALNFAIPKTYKQLKSFVGLAEQFHRFIPKFNEVARPLHNRLRGYNDLKPKTKPLPKDDKTLEIDFRALQTAVSNSQKLHFIEDNREIFLQTDASNYGIGAYLFQVLDDGSQQPVAFISKALQNEQLNWSVPEKEGFAIFYAMCRLEHLIRDVHFVLQTDHKNLTYINYGNSAKIIRWKLHIQEFDFDVEHIAGKENEVADAFSRMIESKQSAQDEELEPHVLHFFEELKIPSERFIEISKIHNTGEGHFGVDKTLQKLRSRNLFWPYQREHVRAFIKKCPLCQKMSMLKTPIHTHPFVLGTFSISARVAIDTVGPLPEDENKNKYIIVMVDCFSRYVLLIPAKYATAISAAKALLQWLALFGTPQQLLSDMGSQYITQIIDELLLHVGTEKLDTMPGIHEENSIVERRNKELVRHIRAIVNHKKIKNLWSDTLPLIQRIMNTNIIETIGVSPAQIMFGNAIDLDRGIFLDPGNMDTASKAIHLSAWMARMLRSQADVIKIAKETQAKHQAEYFERFPITRTEFPEGSYVLKKPMDDGRPDSKLHTYWRGPYRVVKSDPTNPNRITVQNLVTKKLEDFANKQLKPYLTDDNFDSPEEVALMDDDMEIVEKVISHSPKNLLKTPKARIRFRVLYVGDEKKGKSPTTLTYADLRHNEVLHDYLRSNKAVSLIPARYKWGRDGPPPGREDE